MKRLSTVSMRGLASFPAVALLVLIASGPAQAAKPQSAATPAATPASTPASQPTAKKKDEAMNSIDSRIQNLQNTRDCIDKAQTNKGVETCRAGLKRK